MRKKVVLPDFICVGPGKTGTNTLHHCLQEHPSVSMAKHVKGARFFDRFYNRGIDWYAGLFKNCTPDKRVGEISETYFYYKDVPERLHRHIPDVKIITVLRNPVDRSFRVYLQLCKLGLMRGTFDQCLKEHDNLVQDSLYYTHLQRFLQYFPQDQILVLLYDDLVADARSFIRKVYEFVGVDPDFEPRSLNLRLNPSASPRFPIINQLAFRTMWLLRNLDMLSVLAKAKESKFVRKLLFKGYRDGQRPEMSPQARAYLQEAFAEEISELSKYLNRDLSNWK